MIGKRLLCGSSARARTSIPCWNTGDDGKGAAWGLVGRGATLDPLLKQGDRGAGLKPRRFQNPEVDRADLDLDARPPDEVVAIDIGMQGADENTGAPQWHPRMC